MNQCFLFSSGNKKYFVIYSWTVWKLWNFTFALPFLIPINEEDTKINEEDTNGFLVMVLVRGYIQSES